jgi:ribonuclease HI
MSTIIYTDGSSRGNPGPGGWGAHINTRGKIYEIYGREQNTTNNQMELQAAIEALKFFKKPTEIKLYTDSVYVLKGITEWIIGWKKNGWKKKSGQLKNINQWKELDSLNSFHTVDWIKVKGHSGDPGNDRADYLATFQ